MSINKVDILDAGVCDKIIGIYKSNKDNLLNELLCKYMTSYVLYSELDCIIYLGEIAEELNLYSHEDIINYIIKEL